MSVGLAAVVGQRDLLGLQAKYAALAVNPANMNAAQCGIRMRTNFLPRRDESSLQDGVQMQRTKPSMVIVSLNASRHFRMAKMPDTTPMASRLTCWWWAAEPRSR